MFQNVDAFKYCLLIKLLRMILLVAEPVIFIEAILMPKRMYLAVPTRHIRLGISITMERLTNVGPWRTTLKMPHPFGELIPDFFGCTDDRRYLGLLTIMERSVIADRTRRCKYRRHLRPMVNLEQSAISTRFIKPFSSIR